MPVSPLCDEMSVNEKTVRGCIGSSGNVRVYGWIRYRSLVMQYGETCIAGRMDDLHKSLTVALREALVWRKSWLPESRLWLFLGFNNCTFFLLLQALDLIFDLTKAWKGKSAQQWKQKPFKFKSWESVFLGILNRIFPFTMKS